MPDNIKRDPKIKMSFDEIPAEQVIGNDKGPSEKPIDTSTWTDTSGRPYSEDTDPRKIVIPEDQLGLTRGDTRVFDSQPGMGNVMDTMKEPDPDNVRTPGQAQADLEAGKVRAPSVEGISERHTEALADSAKVKARRAISANVQAFADMFQGMDESDPESNRKYDEEQTRRRLADEDWQTRAGLGTSSIINSVLQGIAGKYQEVRGGAPGRRVAKGDANPLINTSTSGESRTTAADEDAINDEMGRNKGRHDVTGFGPGGLEQENKERWSNPYSIRHWNRFLRDRVAQFKSRRRSVGVHYGMRGLIAASANHDARHPTDEQGVVQCGNSACVKGQLGAIKEHLARGGTSSTEALNTDLRNNFFTHHAEEAQAAMEASREIGYEKHKVRYDESFGDHSQPNHTAEQCPWRHPETGEPLDLVNSYGDKYQCNVHMGDPHPQTGKPMASDYSEIPLALTYTQTSTDEHGNKLRNLVTIHRPGHKEFLDNPAWSGPGQLEDRYNLMDMLTEHAKTMGERAKYITGGYGLTHSRLKKAVQAVLGNRRGFERETVNRQKTLTEEVPSHTGGIRNITKRDKDGNPIKIDNPQLDVVASGAVSYRAPGDEFGDIFADSSTGGTAQQERDYISALVDAGMRHFKGQKNKSQEIEDILTHSRRPESRLGKMASRLATAADTWKTGAEAVIKAHLNRSGVQAANASLAQFERSGNADQKLTGLSDTGFDAETRERPEETIAERAQGRISEELASQADQIAQHAGTVTGKNIRVVIPPAVSGGNRGSGVPGSMPIEEPRRIPSEVEEEPEAPMSEYTTTSAPRGPAPTVKTPEETEADIAAYKKQKAAQRKAAKNTPPATED